MKRNKGFTILELMIVIAIIAILLAIVIPALGRARKSSNEASAIGSIRTIITANEQYRTRFSGNGFAVGGPAGAKVYWQVTGERKDQSAEAIRLMMPVEQTKTGELTGRSLDDEFLAGVMGQLEDMGQGSDFEFRTAEGRREYERSLQPPPEPFEQGK